MPTKAEVQEMHNDLKNWDAVGNALGVNKAVAWRYANEPNWEPKRSDLRKALGLSRLAIIDHRRAPDGTFLSKQK